MKNVMTPANDQIRLNLIESPFKLTSVESPMVLESKLAVFYRNQNTEQPVEMENVELKESLMMFEKTVDLATESGLDMKEDKLSFREHKFKTQSFSTG